MTGTANSLAPEARINHDTARVELLLAELAERPSWRAMLLCSAALGVANLGSALAVQPGMLGCRDQYRMAGWILASRKIGLQQRPLQSVRSDRP